jgi:acyl-CoA synthetase (AMP-forming)/AMP-acid ligase II
VRGEQDVRKRQQPGEHVVIILKHSLDLYAAFLGALLHGSIPAMFAFPSHKFSEQEYFATIGELLENANARVLVSGMSDHPPIIECCRTW